MNTRKTWVTPTPEQERQAERVQTAVVAEINLLGRERIEPTVLLAGLTSALCDVLTSIYGVAVVERYFRDQADLIREVTRPN